MEIDFFYSEKTKTPFIEMYDKGKIVFSSMTKTEHGYKWLIYRNDIGDNRQGCMFKMDIEGVKRGTLHIKFIKWLRKLLAKHCVVIGDSMYLPFNNVEKIERAIKKANLKHIIEGKRKYKKRKKKEKDSLHDEKNMLESVDILLKNM